jgi:hypothetical protein
MVGAFVAMHSVVKAILPKKLGVLQKLSILSTEALIGAATADKFSEGCDNAFDKILDTAEPIVKNFQESNQKEEY